MPIVAYTDPISGETFWRFSPIPSDGEERSPVTPGNPTAEKDPHTGLPWRSSLGLTAWEMNRRFSSQWPIQYWREYLNAMSYTDLADISLNGQQIVP